MAKSDTSSIKGSDDDGDRRIRRELRESNTSPQRFKNLKPRLGSQYQTKVAKHPVESFASSRPLPELMSAKEPFLTEQEAQVGVKRPLAPSTTPFAPNRYRAYGAGRYHDRPPTKRGGLCIHRRSANDNAKGFMLFCQRLIRPPGTDEDVVVTEESWKQEMIRQYGSSKTSRRGGGGVKASKRGRRALKRKRSTNDVTEIRGETPSPTLASSSDNDTPVSVLSTCDSDRCSHPQGEVTMMEDDPHVLEYLQQRHNGNVEMAQRATLVDLSSGRSLKARKYLRKHLHNERFKLPPIDSSQSWRRRFERTFPTMLGDLRNDPSRPCAYPYESTGADSANKDGDVAGGESPMSMLSESEEDMKGVWRSVLHHGQIIERSMDENSDSSKRLSMSEVLTFIRSAYGLQTPECSFGTRHIVVEQISICLHAILDHLSKVRDVQAKLMDKFYDETNEGVDLDALKKFLDEADSKIPIRLDEARLISRQLEMSADWQARLAAILMTNDGEECPEVDTDDTTGNLSMAEELAAEAKEFGLRSRDLVLLEKKIDRAYRLRDRIVEWNQKNDRGGKENIRVMTSMVREANRVDLTCPETLQLLRFHRSVEAWIDRANIAIRSRIALSEIESLIEMGELMPLDLSEFLGKLRSRVRVANEWIDELKVEVPCPYVSLPGDCQAQKVNKLAWMAKMREALRGIKDGARGVLLDMASEGSRIPVEIDSVKMLQIEIDAKNWSLKGKKWIPQESNGGSSTSTKRGKLEDLREHYSKAEALRERLVLSPEEKQQWSLDGEAELKAILNAADKWFDEYQEYLEGDNRRNRARSCLSIHTLRQIVDEANQIHANIGTASAKIARIQAQAESWYLKHNGLLVRCGIGNEEDTEETSTLKKLVSLTEMSEAVAEAASDVALDLEEALELGRLVHKTEQWFDKCLLAAPKRSKRTVRGNSSKKRFSVEDVVMLIDESCSLPVDTSADVERLKIQLSLVQTWRLQAHGELREIATSFTKLRDVVTSSYGPPEQFLNDYPTVVKASELAEGVGEEEASPMLLDCPEVVDENVSTPDDASRSDSASCDSSEQDTFVQSQKYGVGGAGVHKYVEATLKNARRLGVYTAEEQVMEVLQKVSKWFLRSLRYFDYQKNLYDKRSVNAFDKFIKEGGELVSHSRDDQSENLIDEVELMRNLNSSWNDLLSDQLVRLRVLQSHRDDFIAWSDSAGQLLSSTEKKIPLETLKKLSEETSSYPASTEIVQKIRALYKKANIWTESTTELLRSGEKLSMHKAKEVFDEGDRLSVTCDELKMLRNVLRAARSWTAKVNRCKPEQGGTHVSQLQELIEEHDSLLIEMPDFVKKLQQALRGYCLCRRPYNGFMLACDSCLEWYHGPCIGVSESQAGRFEKYTCIRCCVTKVFRNSSESVVAVIRKWISQKDRKKSRQTDWQKHQRKVRKEKRDIEKLEPKVELLEQQLMRIRTTASADACAVQEENADINMIPVEESGQSQPENSSTSASLQEVSEKNKSSEEPESTLDNECLPMNVPNGENDCTQAEDAAPVSNAQSNELDTTKNAAEDNPSEADVLLDLEKARKSLKHCHDRLEILSKRAEVVKAEEKEEDEKSDALRKWCVGVCLSVLIPKSPEQSQKSLPPLDGSLSLPMLTMLTEARDLGIEQLPDVGLVSNGFGCISWSLHAMRVLARKPTVAQASTLVSMSSSLKLPEEKSLRMMKSMLQRANNWQSKVSRALAPKPGGCEPCCMSTLKELVSGADNIPMTLPAEARLHSAIEDNGMRHCVCGGPNDGEFMLGCDKCLRWFHGRCVNVCGDVGEQLNNWVCPPCNGGVASPVQISHSVPIGDEEAVLSDAAEVSSDDEDVDDVAPNAPDPIKLWPPFKLLSSEEALEALGKECLDRVFELSSQSETSLDETLVNMSVATTVSEHQGNGVVRTGGCCPVLVPSGIPHEESAVAAVPERPSHDTESSSDVFRRDIKVEVALAVVKDVADEEVPNGREGGNVIGETSHSVQVGGLGISEAGIVTETSVGSVEESDHTNQNIEETNANISSTEQLSMEVADSSSPPISASSG